jgi:hypothetical protein
MMTKNNNNNKKQNKENDYSIADLEFFLLSIPMSTVADFSISFRIASPSSIRAKGIFFSHSRVF